MRHIEHFTPCFMLQKLPFYYWIVTKRIRYD